MGSQYTRHGIGAVRPYLYGSPTLVDWVKKTFGAQVLERTGAEGGEHVELKIGDSVVVLETGDALPAFATPASVYVYVEDVDATYERAMAAGAESLGAPEDKHYEERGAGVKDSFGNTWWFATFTGARTEVKKLVTE